MLATFDTARMHSHGGPWERERCSLSLSLRVALSPAGKELRGALTGGIAWLIPRLQPVAPSGQNLMYVIGAEI
jgi:hypothetical protein